MKIVFDGADGSNTVLKEVPVLANEVVDGTCMNAKALRAFYEKEIADAKEKDVLFSLHLKATMMKVSDPIMFGACCEVFYKDVLQKYADVFKTLGVDLSNGIGDVYSKIKKLPEDQQKAIETDISNCYASKPSIAMVNSDKGITNLHVPSDVIIDASMPAAIRDSGKMWNSQNKLQDAKFCIPDRNYAGVFQVSPHPYLNLTRSTINTH